MTIREREPLVYSPNEARKLLKISRGLIYEAINTGRIPSIRIGRRILIPRAALEQLLDKVVVHNEHRKSNVTCAHRRGNKADLRKS
jgi:excisionase family DNA binding protein